MIISLSKTSLIQGEQGTISIICDGVEHYSQTQIEIYTTGVLNPSSKLGFDTTPLRHKANEYEVELKTSNLDYGVYELKLVRFHSGEESSRRDFIGGKDFERIFFEIIPAIQLPRLKEQISMNVFDKEAQLERRFREAVDIRNERNNSGAAFCVFVFIRGVLIGNKSRFHQYEVIPFNQGLDTRDPLECVNEFLKSNTSTNIAFSYEDNLKQQFRKNLFMIFFRIHIK